MTATAPRLGRAARRASILDASARAFARAGYAGTSMADIAAAAGVSHLIVYRHFDSKAALYDAVLDDAIAHLRRAAAGAGALDAYGTTPGALLAAARAAPAPFRVLWRHAPREPEFSHRADEARDLLLRVTTGALEPIVAAAHRRWAARATVGYLVEAVLVWVEDGDAHLDARFVAATTAALRAGVKSWAKR